MFIHDFSDSLNFRFMQAPMKNGAGNAISGHLEGMKYQNFPGLCWGAYSLQCPPPQLLPCFDWSVSLRSACRASHGFLLTVR